MKDKETESAINEQWEESGITQFSNQHIYLFILKLGWFSFHMNSEKYRNKKSDVSEADIDHTFDLLSLFFAASCGKDA